MYLSKRLINGKLSLLFMISAFLVGVILFTGCQTTGGDRGYDDLDQVVDACYDYLESNLCEGSRWGMDYHFYRPASTKYSNSQWLWDSGWHMLVWSHRDVDNSVKDLRTMLQFQQENGFIPEMIYWESTGPAHFQNSKFTDITQMPMLPYALRAIWNASGDVELMKEFVPKLVDYFQWWEDVRDPDRDGLISVIHPWESGIDASPLYDPAHYKKDPNFIQLYPRFRKLMRLYKGKYHWDQAKILESGLFNVEDVGLCSIYADGWGILGKLAAQFDEEMASYCAERSHFYQTSIINKCWDEEKGMFVSYFHQPDGEKVSSIETVQSLMPLLLDEIPDDMRQKIIANLTDPQKFWLKYPIPSTSISEETFRPYEYRLLWRGPTWPCTNWLVMEGLLKQGEDKIANEILDKWIALYIENGIYEYHDPLTGEASGEEGLGMSHTIVDMLVRLGRIEAPQK